MTDAETRFKKHLSDGGVCLQNFEATGHEVSLRYVWIMCVSAFDLYITELISEAGLRLIDRSPRILTTNIRQIDIPLGNIFDLDHLTPSDRLLFFQKHIFLAMRFIPFYRPDKISEALSYIWTCPAKEKWSRIFSQMKLTGRYDNQTEHDVRTELTLIADRRDLIAHAVDIPPGALVRNPVRKEDAVRVIEFIGDLVSAIDAETESLLSLGL